MNSSHYSKLAIAAVLLAVVAAGPAAAVSVSDATAPDTVEVGSTVDVTYTVEDLYTNYNEWNLEGATELESVTWTVTTYDLSDSQLDKQQYNGQEFSHTLDKEGDVAMVEVRVQGTVPEWSNWSYEPAQSITLADFTESQSGGAENDLLTSTARPYTESSQAARTALDDATAAIQDAEDAGVDVTEATDRLDNARSAFNSGNFENAQDLAGDAQASAESAQQQSQRTSTLLMIGGVVVVLAILAGVGYWYLSNRETYDKLG
ncbi:DUF4398 domain-containing protein [Halodesulfurarchaeum formicicum]|uniref:DUF4398 domain-containing protein n=1 Tax=Halodesulfurarchaeum formicicum TaxID=1873524 RepID=UPI000877F6DF|nr:DUF4398 domain-containing protein [Halodesulfurarchaeum formicicum]